MISPYYDLFLVKASIICQREDIIPEIHGFHSRITAVLIYLIAGGFNKKGLFIRSSLLQSSAVTGSCPAKLMP